jgi:hypothetical protein
MIRSFGTYHVIQGPSTGHRALGGAVNGEAKVSHLDHLIGGQKKVLWLDISMDDVPRVHVAEGVEKGCENVSHSVLFLDYASVAPQLLKEITAPSKLLDHIDVLLILKGCKQLDDVVMVKGYVDSDLTLHLIPAHGRWWLKADR